MKTLDYEYIADLVKRTQDGDSNAFAELYAATYQRQYRYALKNLGDEDKAKQVLQESYVQALNKIHTLQNPELFVAWINRITFRNSTQNLTDLVSIGRKKYSLSQILALPLTESQVLIQHYYQGFITMEIARNLEISRNSVKNYLRTGRKHLRKLLSSSR